jgi:hypothetical protein
MTYASALAAGKATIAKAALIIDGIPVLFSTHSGITMNTSTVFQNGPASLTSVGAIIEPPQIDGQTLNSDTLIVEPGGCKVTLRKNVAWDKYFQPRRPYTVLIGGCAFDDAGFDVASNASTAFAAGSLAFVDRETMLVGSLTGSTYLNVTRKYACLTSSRGAAAHASGAYVSPYPRSMLGRTAELHVWASDTDSTRLRLLVLKHVQLDNERGVWSLTFEDGMGMFDRNVAVGFEETAVLGISLTNGATPVYTIAVSDTEQFTSAADNGAVMIRYGDRAFIGDIASYSGSDPQVSAAAFGSVNNTEAYFNIFGNVSMEDNLTAKRVYVLRGPPMVSMLKVLLSDGGTHANSATYDEFFGITTTDENYAYTLTTPTLEKRMGAAIPAGCLNLTTTGDGLLNPLVLGDTASGFCYVLGGEDTTSLLDVMRQVALALQGFWYMNADGKLSFKRLAGTYSFNTIDAALTETNILRFSPLDCVNDETEVVQSVTIKCNYDPGAGKTLGTVNAYYPRAYEAYRSVARKMEMETHSLVISYTGMVVPLYCLAYGIQPATLADLRARFDRMFYRRQNGLLKYTLELPWKYHTLTPGSLVTITHSGLEAMDGSTLNGQTFLVSGISKIDMETGAVTIAVEETWSGKPVSPTCKVASYAAGVITLTVSDKYGSGATPSSWFAVGWKLRLLDYSVSPPFSAASPVLTVTAVSGATVTVTGMGAFAPAAGDILVQAQYDDSNSTATNTAQIVSQRGHVFGADANWRLGASDVEADKWG